MALFSCAFANVTGSDNTIRIRSLTAAGSDFFPLWAGLPTGTRKLTEGSPLSNHCDAGRCAGVPPAYSLNAGGTPALQRCDSAPTLQTAGK